MTNARKIGRPEKPPHERATERVEVRLTPKQKAEWDRQGGAAWLKSILESILSRKSAG